MRIFNTKGKADGRFDHLIFSPDSHYLIALGKSTLVWDLTAKEPKGPVAKLPAAITCGFSADGKTLALDNIGCITLWRVGEWKMLPQSADPVSPVNRVKFVADGKKVLGYTHNSWLSWPTTGGPTRISDVASTDSDDPVDISVDGRVAVEVLPEPGERRGSQGKSTLRP